MAKSIVIVAPDMQRGGSVGAVAWRQAIELSRNYRIRVITRAAPDDLKSEIEVLIVRPRNWNWLRRFCHVPNEISFLLAVRHTLRDLCIRNSVDVVWCHSHGATVLAAAPLTKRFGFKVVMTTHGDVFDRPPGTYSRELTLFYKLVTPRAYRQSDSVQALSPYMAEWAAKGGARNDRVRVIPNGVDPKEIGAVDLAPRSVDSFMPAGKLRLLYVGSLWNLKGIDVLMRAVAHLVVGNGPRNEESPFASPCSVSLTLIGEGTLRPQLEKLAATLGIADRTQFAGRLPRRELAGHYRQADILCVPSLSDALPTVALEGMLCGLPIVGSDTGGMPFLVDHGLNGYLATPGNVAGLAAAITRAATSSAHLAELGEEGFRKARTRFDWTDIAQQLDALVRDSVMPGHELPESR